MSKAWTLTCLLLLSGTGAAEESKKVKFHVDPPNFTVAYKSTVTGGITSNAPTAQAQELALPPISGGYYQMPDDAFKRGRCELVFHADGYEDFKDVIESNALKPGVNEWPVNGKTIVMQPKGFAVIGQFFRLHAALAGFLTLLVGGLSAYVAVGQLKKARLRKYQNRLQELGGEPDAKPIGPFLPVGVLGQGGFGVVVKGIRSEELYQKNPEIVAVKTLLHVNLDEQLKEGSEAETRRARFRREAQVLERLEHPNIVRLVHYSLEGSTPYLAMEYVDGESFLSIIRKHPSGMSPTEALRLILPVCEAMLYAHTRSPEVIHRDLKPENIMISREGKVKVMDLGLAHSLGEKRITKTHEWTGTPQYASPEYLSGVVSPAVDQFAIGLVLFELLVGHAANASANAEAAIHAVLLGNLPTLLSVRPQWGDFARAVDRMSHNDYNRRFPSLAEAMEALKATCPKA